MLWKSIQSWSWRGFPLSLLLLILILELHILIKIFRSLHPMGSLSLDRAQWHEDREQGHEHFVVRSTWSHLLYNPEKSATWTVNRAISFGSYQFMETFHFSKGSLESKVQEKLSQALTTWQLRESGVSGQEYSKLFLVILVRWKPCGFWLRWSSRTSAPSLSTQPKGTP